jgi:hypothetical protein
VAENNLTPEQLQALQAISAEREVYNSEQAALQAQLVAVDAVTPAEREALEAVRAERQAAQAQAQETERLANRTNYERGFEEQGLTNRVPGPIRAIDRALHGTRNIPFLPSADAANRFMSQTLDSAVLDYLPAGPKNWLAERGIGYPAGVDAEGVAGAAGKGIGMAAPYVVAPLVAGEKLAVETALNLTPRMNINPLRATLEEMYKTYLKNPAMFLAAEAGGAAGAQVIGEAFDVSDEDKSDASPERIVTQRLMAELLGGFIGSLTPGALPSTLRRAKQSIQANLLPFTTAGGEIRAARQMQARAGGQAQREMFVELLKNMPEGVTPAQWLGDDALLAQQARILADDKKSKNSRGLTEEVGAQLMQARQVLLEELYDTDGNPRTRLEWFRSIIQRVTPVPVDKNNMPAPVEIDLADEDVMLSQAFDVFKPLYKKFQDFDVSPEDVGDLEGSIIGAADSPYITASNDSVNTARRWLKNLVSTYKDDDAAADLAVLDTPPPAILDADGKPMRPVTEPPAPPEAAPLEILDTGDALLLRSKLRAEIRRLGTREGNQEVRDLYSVAEAQLTDFINTTIDAVDPKAALQLSETDGIYAQYKVIENAVFRSGDKTISADNVSESIRASSLASEAQYARGDVEAVQELRDVAIQGGDVAEYLRKPESAARIVRGLEPEEKTQVQAEFIQYLLDNALNAPTAQTIEVPIAGGGVGKIIMPSSTVLEKSLLQNIDVMRSLGMTDVDIKRVTDLADVLVKYENSGPDALAKLFEDGPASLLELGAVLIGTGQAGMLGDYTGVGGSLVLAQFMANNARRMLATMTSDQAAKMMADALTDAELTSALLLKDIAPRRKLIEGAKYLENYLYSAPFSALGELEEGEERPLAPADPLFIEEQVSVPAPDPVGQMTASQQMLRRIPPAPSTRGVPGLGEPANDVAATPAMAPPSAVAQGPSESSEMMARLFPMDMV